MTTIASAPGVHPLPRPVDSQELARQLGLVHRGPAKDIGAIAGSAQSVAGCLTFGRPEDGDWRGAVWIGRAGAEMPATATLVESGDLRLDFVRALHLLREDGNWPVVPAGEIAEDASIDKSAAVARGAHVGAGCVIGPNAVVHDAVWLAAGVRVGAGTVIGHPGFGYARLPDGTPLHFPHLGRAIVEDGVSIGNLCSVSRGTLIDTRIGRETKIDDQCYVAHNVSIGEKTLVMSGVRLNGGATIGARCWLGTAAIVREYRSVGEAATVGMGAVVVKNVEAGQTVAGNPARPLE